MSEVLLPRRFEAKPIFGTNTEFAPLIRIEYESIPTPGVDASALHGGEPLRLVRRGQRREGIIDGIQLAPKPYWRDRVALSGSMPADVFM